MARLAILYAPDSAYGILLVNMRETEQSIVTKADHRKHALLRRQPVYFARASQREH